MKAIGNKVLVTGGSSGIGIALCEAFLERGNQVIAIGRNTERLQEAKKKVPGITTYLCDLSYSAEIDSLQTTLLQDHPDLNILINNAGVQYRYHLLEEAHALTKIEKEVQINLLAPLRLTTLLLPELIRQPEAAVVNVTSGLAVVPKPTAPIYCPTKAGLRSFTQTLRDQLIDTPVKVFEIIPPVVQTNMTRGRTEKMISPEEVALAFMKAFERNEFEVQVGQIRQLFLLNRWLPGVAKRLIRKN